MTLLRREALPDDGLEVAISKRHDNKEGVVLEVLKVSANKVRFSLHLNRRAAEMITPK
jgi:hypothetical protein